MEMPDGFDDELTEYEEYQLTPEWKSISEKIKKRDGYKCVFCGSQTKLNVHHLTYKHIYHEDEHLEDLVTLCESHHKGYHFVRHLEFERDEQIQKEEKEIKSQINKEYWANVEETANQIMEDIKHEYLDQDYSSGGPLDMCDWEVIESVIAKKCEEIGYSEPYGIGKQKIHKYFLYRRYEFLLKCMNQGFTAAEVAEKSSFSISWVTRNYKRKFLEDKLKEEKFIQGKEGEI